MLARSLSMAIALLRFQSTTITDPLQSRMSKSGWSPFPKAIALDAPPGVGNCVFAPAKKNSFLPCHTEAAMEP